jgi:hypothetical protein
MIGLCFVITLAANPGRAELKTAWQRFAESESRHLRVSLPTVTDADWTALAYGDTVTHRYRPVDSPIQRVLALRFIDQPPSSVWLAILDGDHAGLPPEITNWDFPGATGTAKVRYTRLDLPFPVSDRHWVIAARSNAELYQATDGAAWERSWDLDPRGETALQELPKSLQAAGEDAVWTPRNRGGWLLLTVSWGTLAVYQLETDIGGWIPDGLVARYAESMLNTLVGKTATLADREAVHYTTGHQPIEAPDGTVVPPF